MNPGLRCRCTLAICAAGFALFAAAQQIPGSPAIRHSVKVSIPTRLKVQRTAGRLLVSYDPASLRNVKVLAGQEMTIGVADEFRVYLEGETRPAQYRSSLSGSMNKTVAGTPLSDPDFLQSTETLTNTKDGIPNEGKHYIVEHDIIVFETDVPVQHFWNPGSSPRYRILWQKRLRAAA